MEKVRDYLLGQADKITAWIGFIGLCLYVVGMHSALVLLFVALVALPEAQFSELFRGLDGQAAEAERVTDLLAPAQVAARLGVSVRTLWRMAKAEGFPPPVRFSRKLVRWRAADIERYVASLPT